jgi:hypothetical protein
MLGNCCTQCGEDLSYACGVMSDHRAGLPHESGGYSVVKPNSETIASAANVIYGVRCIY